VQVRLADVHVARRFEPQHRLGGRRRDVVGEDRRAVRRGQAGGVEEILDGERDPLARPLRPSEKDPFSRFVQWMVIFLTPAPAASEEGAKASAARAMTSSFVIH
jgi:hypothetical protein